MLTKKLLTVAASLGLVLAVSFAGPAADAGVRAASPISVADQGGQSAPAYWRPNQQQRRFGQVYIGAQCMRSCNVSYSFCLSNRYTNKYLCASTYGTCQANCMPR